MTILSDGARELLAELDRDAFDAWVPEVDDCATCGGDSIACPDCRPIDLGDIELMRPPAAADLAGPAGPSAVDRAWKSGFDAGRESAEAELRDLEFTISHLEMLLAEARAELSADAGR